MNLKVGQIVTWLEPIRTQIENRGNMLGPRMIDQELHHSGEVISIEGDSCTVRDSWGLIWQLKIEKDKLTCI
jgi:hypothetical protein